MTFEHATAGWDDAQIKQLKKRLSDSTHLKIWVDHQIFGHKINSDIRSRLSNGYFDISHEHRSATVVLTENGLFSSAKTLVQLMFEAHVKGTWLAHGAPESHLERMEIGENFPPQREMIDDIEKYYAEFHNDILFYREIKNEGHWDELHNSAANESITKIITTSQARLNLKQVCDYLEFADMISLLSFANIFYFTSSGIDRQAGEAALKKIKEIVASKSSTAT